MKIVSQQDDVPVARKKQMNFEPKLIMGGQPPSTGNWLTDLPVGARFSVYSKNDLKNFMALDLEIVNKTDSSVYLYELSTGNPLGQTGRVYPPRFVQQFNLLERFPDIVEMLPKEEETLETTDGASNRPGDLVT